MHPDLWLAMGLKMTVSDVGFGEGGCDAKFASIKRRTQPFTAIRSDRVALAPIGNAMEFALRHPGRLDRMILTGTPGAPARVAFLPVNDLELGQGEQQDRRDLRLPAIRPTRTIRTKSSHRGSFLNLLTEAIEREKENCALYSQYLRFTQIGQPGLWRSEDVHRGFLLWLMVSVTPSTTMKL